MAPRVASVLAALAFLAGCQVPGAQPHCTSSSSSVNFIQVGSSQYGAGPSSPAVLQETDLGPVYSHTRFKVSGNVCDPNYRLKDGDAAFLEPGTPVYQVSGRAATEELAARFNGSILA